MDKQAIERFVKEKTHIAETYFDHGLVVECRKIYASLFNGLLRLEEGNRERLSPEEIEYLSGVREELERKLRELDQRVERLRSSSFHGSPVVKEEKEEETPQSVFQRGIGLRDLGLAREALPHFREALAKGYDPYACLVEIYRIQVQNEEFEALIQEMQEALSSRELPPEDRGDLLRRLGLLYEKCRRIDEALAAYKEAIQLHPALREKLEAKIQKLENREPMSPASGEEEGISFDGSQLDVPAVEAGIEMPEEKERPQEMPEDSRVRRLEEEIERLKSEEGRLRLLLEEYQKRYQDILNYSNVLQKENRELKNRLRAYEKEEGRSA